jgi:hypothetical protein
MEGTIFKNIKSTSAGYVRSIDIILDRIKTGASKDLVLKIRNGEKENKMLLPAICFSGKFKNRSKSGIINHSGIICLDFDKLPDNEALTILKETIEADKYTFASFISPSGNGLKVLVKIPATIDEHKQHFDALSKYYDSEYFDISTSDVSRVCFESYDPNIFINHDGLLFETKEQPTYEHVGTDMPNIAETKSYVIIQNLLKWWESKFPMIKGQRNENLIKLALAFNDFGVSKEEARSVFLGYETTDFSESRLMTTLNSGYKKTENFGSKFFEDYTTKNKIEKDLKAGKGLSEIKRKYKGVGNIEAAISDIADTVTTDEFWKFDKSGKCHLIHHKFKSYLESNQIFKYYHNDSGFFFVKIFENQVSIITAEQIKDFVLSDVYGREGIGMMPYEMMAGSTKYFKEDYLTFLDSIELTLKQDTKDACYLYYKNCALEITKDAIKEITYVDLEGYVWQNHIIDRDYLQNGNCEGMYHKFINLIAGEDINRFASIKSTIGYLLHSFKTSANNKAIILNDEVISENPNGGSGKGIFVNGLGKMKRTSIIDGKQFDFDKTFPYQTVNLDSQLLVFDDVKKNFYFERLFSVITEGITIEKKNKDAIKVGVENSPKVLITTNYTIGGVGGSFERRKFELEFSSYFGSNHSPLDEFGCMLFDDWDSKEWIKFDCFMIECLKLYLKKGLILSDYQNLKTRKFIKETSHEFYEWSKDDNNIIRGVRNYNKDLHKSFTEEYPDFMRYGGGLSFKKFSLWIETFAQFNDLEYSKDRDQQGRYIEIHADKLQF